MEADRHFAIEFAAVHALIPCNPETSIWYSPLPIRANTEDTQPEVLTSLPPFETLFPEPTSAFIFTHFSRKIEETITTLTMMDTLVIVLIGCRPLGSAFLLSPEGQVIFGADELEFLAWHAKCKIVVVLPCCDPDYWVGPWTLLTASGRNMEGTFTDIYQMLHGSDHPQSSFTPSGFQVSSPAHSVRAGPAAVDIFDWFDALRDVNHADYNLTPANMPRNLLSCIGPAARTLPQPSPDPLSAQEEAELGPLCEHFRRLPERHFYPKITLLQSCYEYSNGTLKDDVKPGVYKMLSRRQKRCALAVDIAAALGWNVGEELGNPVNQAAMPPSTEKELREHAEHSGCRVSRLVMEDPMWQWTVAADWLAKAWKAAGCPQISEQEWNNACK